jgi:ComEC/Rec2-related protein
MLAFRGRLLFVATAAFALGILWGTIGSIPWFFLTLSIFIGALSLLLAGIITNSSVGLQYFLLALGIASVLFPMGEVRAALAPHELPSSFATSLNQKITYTGIVTGDPDVRAKNQQLMVAVTKGTEHTTILVFAPLTQRFVYGEQIRIAGILTAPTSFLTDSGRTFQYDNYLAKKGIFATVPKATVVEVHVPTGILAGCANFLFATKHTFVQGLARALPEPYAGIATGLLTGDQHSISDSVENLLVVSGLLWIVVLSGYHITLIANGTRGLFRFLPRGISYAAAGISVMAIIFVTGASAPSLRGGFMACLTLFAQSTRRQYDAFRSLAAAIICILLWNPFLLAYDSGFQLSIVVTPAILFFVPRVERKLVWIKSKFIREVIAVSVVAQLSCVPLILWQTGQVSPWAIPANFCVMALISFAMLSCFVAGMVGALVPPLASLAGLPAYAILCYMLWIAKAAASLPLSNLTIPSFSFVYVIALYVFLFICTLKLTHITYDTRTAPSSPIPPQTKSASQLLPS